MESPSFFYTGDKQIRSFTFMLYYFNSGPKASPLPRREWSREGYASAEPDCCKYIHIRKEGESSTEEENP
jgi:hypothetical protein